jgi:NitT/TauT family transport system substrate-binding protein
MRHTFGILLSLMIFMGACSSPSQDPLKISTTTWIGYTPLFYAKEKGWLDRINVKLINVVSLSENMYLYKAGNSNAYCGTQYEHSVLKDSMPSLIPIMLFDRSNGGDMIMSNHTIEEIKNSTTKIDAYLEMDSINYTMLEDFIHSYHIDEKRINYIDRDQIDISTLKNTHPEKQILIVTYIPYDNALKRNGFQEILSTKNGLDLLVVDALYTTKENFHRHKQQYTQVKTYIDDAIMALSKDPKEFFITIEPYMEGLSYEEFLDSLDDIIWINNTVDERLMERMRVASFPTKDLL